MFASYKDITHMYIYNLFKNKIINITYEKFIDNDRNVRK